MNEKNAFLSCAAIFNLGINSTLFHLTKMLLAVSAEKNFFCTKKFLSFSLVTTSSAMFSSPFCYLLLMVVVVHNNLSIYRHHPHPPLIPAAADDDDDAV